VRVPQTAQDAHRPVAVTHVRAVRIPLVVGVRVVLAVVCDPVQQRPLDGHRAEHGERVLDRLGRLEGAVREHPVEADGHAESGQHVHDGKDGQVGRADDAVPQQQDRGDRAGERQRHGDQVHALLQGAHSHKPVIIQHQQVEIDPPIPHAILLI
jgi:hypothetical protein